MTLISSINSVSTHCWRTLGGAVGSILFLKNTPHHAHAQQKYNFQNVKNALILAY